MFSSVKRAYLLSRGGHLFIWELISLIMCILHIIGIFNLPVIAFYGLVLVGVISGLVTVHGIFYLLGKVKNKNTSSKKYLDKYLDAVNYFYK